MCYELLTALAKIDSKKALEWSHQLSEHIGTEAQLREQGVKSLAGWFGGNAEAKADAKKIVNYYHGWFSKRAWIDWLKGEEMFKSEDIERGNRA